MQGVDCGTKQNAGNEKQTYHTYFTGSIICILRVRLYFTAEELKMYY